MTAQIAPTNTEIKKIEKIRFLSVEDVKDIFGIGYSQACVYRRNVAKSLGKSTYHLTLEDMKRYYKV